MGYTSFVPGRLTAIAWNGDTELGRMELTTAGAPSTRVTRESGSGSLHFYSIELADTQGVLNPAEDWDLSIQVENGRLLAFGSADPKPDYTAAPAAARTWQGRAQAIVLSDETPVITVQRK